MEITSRKNPTITLLKQLSRDKKTRDEQGLFLIEGEKLALEAVKSGLSLEYALLTKKAAAKYPAVSEQILPKCDIITISEDVADAISDQKTPQGVFVAAKILDKSVNLDTILSGRRLLVLERLQDAGNVGTIIRAAEALGIDGVVLSPDTADIFSPKTVRAAMGSSFRLPLLQADLQEFLPSLQENGFVIYAAMLDDTALPLGSELFPEKSAVIIGNEGRGVTEQSAALCDKKLYIPINAAESLNAAAAAAIISWELGKK